MKGRGILIEEDGESVQHGTPPPRRYVRLLDGEGSVRGKTWRDMPSMKNRGGRNYTRGALEWWLWKRGLSGGERVWRGGGARVEEEALGSSEGGGGSSEL